MIIIYIVFIVFFIGFIGFIVGFIIISLARFFLIFFFGINNINNINNIIIIDRTTLLQHRKQSFMRISIEFLSNHFSHILALVTILLLLLLVVNIILLGVKISTLLSPPLPSLRSRHLSLSETNSFARNT